MATMTVDIEYLSTYLSLPQSTLSSVIDAPTAECVRSVLNAITIKAHEHDELAADKLRVDIELENAIRTSETRIDGLRLNLDKAQKTVEEVRIKLSEEENKRLSVENELQTIKSSSITSTTEVKSLRSRIASLEAANRETIAVVELKSTANDELAKDLQKQHQKGLELSQQINTLQQDVQNARSAASSANFREGSLKQELELVKRNNEWLESELKAKSAEAMKYRREKGTRVAELQRTNEELTSNLESMKRTEQALRTRLDEVQKKAEDSLARIQQLQEEAAKIEDGFQQELVSSRRLAELQSQQAQIHRNRLSDVEASIEKVKDNAAEEVGRCRAEAEAERQDREHAENRITELESEVERLESLLMQGRQISRPGTPHQASNGSLFGNPSSPLQFRTPSSVRGKSMVTATHAIEELCKVKIELKKERLKTESLETQMNQMIEGLEAKKPYIDELELENKRLEMELIEMSKFVDQTGKERETAMKNARQAKSEASTAQAEANILNQQLRDLSSQVKILLADQVARDRGWDALNETEKVRFDSFVKNDIADSNLDCLTATDRLISERLVAFRNISELQQKNQEQLKIIRQLGAQMESEEALAAKHQAAEDHEEVQRLLRKIEDYKDELHNLTTRSESYIKERDMFRRMLQHRGQIPQTTDLYSTFGQSINSYQNGYSTEPGDANSADLTTAIRNLQTQYDQYREEQTIDRKALKDQAVKLSQEKNILQAEIAKVNSKLMLVSDRYDLLNSNYLMLGNENKELQKRSELLSEAAAKQDIRTQQVAEDLVEAKGLLESMRNENANLKAEKKLWKDIQERLNQDNEALVNERTRLNTLIANQQTLQNERELSESETRRRLQAQVESLEAELNTAKRKLSDEIEDNKKAQMRKEFDSQQNQNRVDSLASNLSLVREELIAAKTSRDHLQSRVNELTIELKSAEERVKLLQPKPTQRIANGDVLQDNLVREQDLSIEVSELKRDLDLAKSELESTRVQMEQYKSIAQCTEEEMQSLNNTSDQFREEMDQIVEGKNNKIRDLEQQVDDISVELTKTNNELANLRNQQGEITKKYEEEKVCFQNEISRLKDEDERHASVAHFHQQDLRAQAEIAAKAQQSYENELVKHAEAAKLLQNVRAELNQMKVDSATLRSEAESSRVVLSQSEISWGERREQLEQEIKELRCRRDDLNAQNRILHEQLENVNAQVSSLQQSRNMHKETEDSTLGPDAVPDRNMDGLRELNSFLRREKEIVEVQYDLKVQEAKRLQQQLEYAQSQLDETRLKLDQERRSHADMGRSSVSHKDLMEKLNELNLFRESSTTLRNELRQAQSQLAEKTKRVEDLLDQIQPLEMRIRELEHNKETLEGEIRLLAEDRDRWQKRVVTKESEAENTKRVEDLLGQIQSLEMRIRELQVSKETLEGEMRVLVEDRDQWQKRALTKESEVLSTPKISAPDIPVENNSEGSQEERTSAGNGSKEIEVVTNSGLSDAERKALEDQIASAEGLVKEYEKKIKIAEEEMEALVKEYESKAKRIEEEMEIKLKKRSDAMKTALNKKLAEAKQTQKAEIEAEYKLKLEQEKQIWIAESKVNESIRTPQQPTVERSLQTDPTTPIPQPIPAQTQSSKSLLLADLSDDDARQLCQSNRTIREIIKGNIVSKLAIEIQKLKDEHSKILAEAQQKADINRVQAVSMESKRSALKMNMTENRIRLATGKLQIVEQAAQETPQRAVSEIWSEVKNYKLPPVVSSTPAQTASSGGAASMTNTNAFTPSKQSLSLNNPVDLAQSSALESPAGSIKTSPLPSGNILSGPQSNHVPQRVSSIPMMRGGGNIRARGGHQTYQPPKGGIRGRGGALGGGGINRGGHGMNVGAGQVSIKRPRDDGTTGIHPESSGKRPREG
ncbi:hypothetical protein K3495_g8355 [Podosphaera aphanis]|nr:hypothetical protein K3495_g8355 [Podosphaera aphanis]